MRSGFKVLIELRVCRVSEDLVQGSGFIRVQRGVRLPRVKHSQQVNECGDPCEQRQETEVDHLQPVLRAAKGAGAHPSTTPSFSSLPPLPRQVSSPPGAVRPERVACCVQRGCWTKWVSKHERVIIEDTKCTILFSSSQERKLWNFRHLSAPRADMRPVWEAARRCRFTHRAAKVRKLLTPRSLHAPNPCFSLLGRAQR